MKKPSIHHFDASGRALINVEYLEGEVARVEAENERLKRIILLQQQRWNQAHGITTKKPTFH